MPVTRFPLPPTTSPHTPPPRRHPRLQAHLAHETARAVLKENPLPHRQPMAGTSFPARGNFHPSHHALTPRLRPTCPSFVTAHRHHLNTAGSNHIEQYPVQIGPPPRLDPLAIEQHQLGENRPLIPRPVPRGLERKKFWERGPRARNNISIATPPPG